MDRIVGICRFSYVGRSDWKVFSKVEGQDEALLAKVAKDLFRPERMAQRLRSFRDVTLASLAAQSDRDFIFLVISSDRMPEPMKKELRALCASVPQIQLYFASEPTLGDALAPILSALAKEAGRPVVQFRLDDDDGLPQHFIRNLRGHAQRLAGFDRFGISFSRGMMCKLEPESAPVPLLFNLPFLGAGCAVRLTDPSRCIFAMGHYQIPRRMTVIQDFDNAGAFVLRWVASDSTELKLDRLPREIERLSDARARDMIAQDYPWLDIDRLVQITQAA